MARPAATEPVDFGISHRLSFNLIERATCPPRPDALPAGRPWFVLLKDADERGLRVKVTEAGGKLWQYETRLRGGKLFTRSLGKWPEIDIKAAQAETRRLRSLREAGRDPREAEQEQAARDREVQEIEARERHEQRLRLDAQERARAEEAAQHASREEREALTVGAVWAVYLEARRDAWGDRNYQDHLKLASAGGVPRKRASGETKPGPLHPLMGLRLVDLTPELVLQWAKDEAPERAARVRLALRLLRSFLNWAARQKAYRDLVQLHVGTGVEVREAAGRPARKVDVLQKSDLAGWFREVRAIANTTDAAFLQVALLTGARRNELETLRWDGVNFERHQLEIHDKIEGDRTIPLTPYVAELLRGLPRVNDWVFAAARLLSQTPKNIRRRQLDHERRGTTAPVGEIADTTATGHILDASPAHRAACARAGLGQFVEGKGWDGLTLHGLRRSFVSLSEWIDIPTGIVAQVVGHRPSATAEKHYRVRPVELVRKYHEKIERWMLEQAEVRPACYAAPTGGPSLSRVA